MMDQSICIIAFSPIQRDARVLRQLKYLAPYFNLSVIGYGDLDQELVSTNQINWTSLTKDTGTILLKAIRLIFLFLGRLIPSLYGIWYWQKSHNATGLQEAINCKSQLYYANDWDALPIAAEAAKKVGGKVILDLHEYAPLEFENIWFWRLLHAPMIRYFLKKYIADVAASITVAPLIAERYQQEFALDPIVVLNTPQLSSVPKKELVPHDIKLVHHGVANRDRRLEVMIETIALCDQRFSLHLMLIETDQAYIDFLKNLAIEVATNRVIFHEPVPPAQIVPEISKYDIGFYPLAPTSYNNSVALPNKFFDFIMAGLAVCIGPSPAMADIVGKHKCGCIAPSFEPTDIAQLLNALQPEEIINMQNAAQQAAQQFNADHEMAKVVNLCRQLTQGS